MGRPSPHVVSSRVKPRKHDRQGDGVFMRPVMHKHVVDRDQDLGRTICLKEQLAVLLKGLKLGWDWCCHAHCGVPSAHAVGHAVFVGGVEDPFAIHHPLVGVVARPEDGRVCVGTVLRFHCRLGGPSCEVSHDFKRGLGLRREGSVKGEGVSDFAFGQHGNHSFLALHIQFEHPQTAGRRARKGDLSILHQEGVADIGRSAVDNVVDGFVRCQPILNNPRGRGSSHLNGHDGAP